MIFDSLFKKPVLLYTATIWFKLAFNVMNYLHGLPIGNSYTSWTSSCITLNNTLLNMNVGQSQSTFSDRFMKEKRNASFNYKICTIFRYLYIVHHLLKRVIY